MQIVIDVNEQNIDNFLHKSLPSQLSADINTLGLQYNIFTTENLVEKVTKNDYIKDVDNFVIKTSIFNENGNFIKLNCNYMYPSKFFPNLFHYCKNNVENIWVPRLIGKTLLDLNKVIEDFPNGLFVDNEDFYWKYSDNCILHKIINYEPIVVRHSNLHNINKNLYVLYNKSLRNFDFQRKNINLDLFNENNIFSKNGKKDSYSPTLLQYITDFLINFNDIKDIQVFNKLIYKEYTNYINPHPKKTINKKSSVKRKARVDETTKIRPQLTVKGVIRDRRPNRINSKKENNSKINKASDKIIRRRNFR